MAKQQVPEKGPEAAGIVINEFSLDMRTARKAAGSQKEEKEARTEEIPSVCLGSTPPMNPRCWLRLSHSAGCRHKPTKVSSQARL